MALVREGLWGIVAGTEKAPDATTEADKHAKFMGRSDRALATIVYWLSTLRYSTSFVASHPGLGTRLPRWRPGGSSGSLKEAVWTIPEEDLGEQALSQKEAVYHEVE